MLDPAELRTVYKLPVKILLMYIVSALLFLTSVELHIHPEASAANVGHGVAVSISSLTGDLSGSNSIHEINISTDGVLKAQQNNFNLLAVFLLVALLVTFQRTDLYTRLQDRKIQLTKLVFYVTPPLRAPPQ